MIKFMGGKSVIIAIFMLQKYIPKEWKMEVMLP